MLARANMYRICTPTLLLVHYIPHTKYASRSSSRPQGLYMLLAKLCKAFAGAEYFIPCSLRLEHVKDAASAITRV